MNKNSIYIFLLLVSLRMVAQTPTTEWTKCFGGSNGDGASSIKQTSDGGYIVIGNTSSDDGDVLDPPGYIDFWVLKLNSVGEIEWQKTLGSTNTDSAYDIEQTSDGGYVFVGTVGNSNGDVIGIYGAQIWVVKLNSVGTITWQKTLGGSSEEIGYCIKQTTDGGYVIAGSNSSNDGDVTGNHGFVDAWIVKLNSSGAIQWQKSYGGTTFDEAYSIQQTSDGGYIVAAYTNSNNGNVTNFYGFYDIWILKLNSSGNLVWQKTIGGSGQDIPNDIQLTNDGGFIIAGGTTSTDGDVTNHHGSMDAWIVKMSSVGNIQWQKAIGGLSGDVAKSIQQTEDENYVICGYVSSNDGDIIGNHPFGDGWVFKLNLEGSITWQKYIVGNNSDDLESIQQTTDGGFIVAGATSSSNVEGTSTNGFSDYLVTKLTPETLGLQYLDHQKITIFPNPTSHYLTIDAPNTSINKIKIIDISGKIIYSAEDESKNIDVSKFASGIYTIEFVVNNSPIQQQTFVKK